MTGSLMHLEKRNPAKHYRTFLQVMKRMEADVMTTLARAGKGVESQKAD